MNARVNLDAWAPLLSPENWLGGLGLSFLATGVLCGLNFEIRALMSGDWLRMIVATWTQGGSLFFWAVPLFLSGAPYETVVLLGLHPAAAFVGGLAAVGATASTSVALRRIAYVRDAVADFEVARWTAAQTAWWGLGWKHAPKPPGSGRAVGVVTSELRR